MKTKSMFAGFLSVAVGACAVLGLASSASAETHAWRSSFYSPTAVDQSWSTATNWADGAGTGFPGVPGPGNTIRNLGRETDPVMIMDKDYSASSISYCWFSGGERAYIQNFLKLTSTTVGLRLWNGGDYMGASAYVRVDSNGTIDGTISLGNEGARPVPVIDFAGGNWVAGTLYVNPTGNRQGGVIRVSTNSGALTPVAALVGVAPEAVVGQRPGFDFVLTAAGVAPITFTASDPLQFTGGAAGTNPFRLSVNMSSYTGPAESIPLFNFSGGTDPARMFDPANITITGAPVAGSPWSVVQTDSGVTLTPTNAPSPPSGTVFIVR